MRLQDKVAMVTGSRQGMGRAMLIRLAEEGTKVVISEINSKTLEDTAKEVETRRRDYLAVKADVIVKAEIKQMVEKAISASGRIDILVNNAGSLRGTPR
jgi:3-oxoacyl-[acyl-carrier protein] reductase